tara:strand:+ start:4169 stop:4474 length:306 start_codon:yes stop_codon:yes gene_type:complete
MDHLYKIVLTQPCNQPDSMFAPATCAGVVSLLKRTNFTVTNYSQWILCVHNITPKDTATIHALQDKLLDVWLKPLGWAEEGSEFTVEDFIYSRIKFSEYHG